MKDMASKLNNADVILRLQIVYTMVHTALTH